MTLGIRDEDFAALAAGAFANATLDSLFLRAAMREPRNWALIDPPNRRSFADGAPRYVSFAAADRMVSAIAGRLRRIGLARESVVALQFPNMVEGVLSLLGVLRAGMIAAPIPLLWRRDDIVPALSRINAKAIIAGGRVGSTDLTKVAMSAAADVFGIRFVCGFGDTLADGIIPLNELFVADRLDPVPRNANSTHPANQIALITWDTTARGLVPIARNHAELIAGGMTVALEGEIEQGARFLATCLSDSFAGLALSVVPWLISGGTLLLHQPFHAAVFAQQCDELRCDTIALPGPLLAQFAEADLLGHMGLKNVLALWRSPERLGRSPRWTHAAAGLVDVQAFGEIGLIAARRDAFGLPTGLPQSAKPVSRGAEKHFHATEIMRSGTGTLLLRGAMAPRQAYTGDVNYDEKSSHAADTGGFVDTGYPCRIVRDTGLLEISGPPASIINVGGYRLVSRTLQEQVGLAGNAATIAALPDALLSHRIAGSATDRTAARLKLLEKGVNALLTSAFRDIRKPRVA